VLGLEREQARLHGDTGQREAEIARARGRIGETRLEIIQLEDDARTKTLQELGEAESRIAELQERQLEARTKLARTSMRAPLATRSPAASARAEEGSLAPFQTIPE
jgi:HlyD family secretion protein